MSKKYLYFLLLLIIVAVGAAVRFFFFLNTNFPLNDGGLFYAMVEDLLNSGFKLPTFTSYNGLSIPFAYPPLGLYLIAFLSKLLKVNPLLLFMALPFYFSTLTIPFSYLVFRKIFDKKKIALVSTLIFALVPSSYTWQIMGGGLTRSLGFMFSLLAIYFSLEYLEKKDKPNLVLASITTSLVILSHLQWAVFVVPSTIFILLHKRIFKRTIRSYLVIVLVAGVLSGVWWLDVVFKHGLGPFISFLKAGTTTKRAFSDIFLLAIGHDHSFFLFFPFFLGAISLFLKGEPYIVIWYLVLYLITPRSSVNLTVTPFAAIATKGLVYLGKKIRYLVNISFPRIQKYSSYLYWIVGIWLIAIFTFFTLSGSFLYLLEFSSSNLEAMKWVEGNVGKEESFLVLTPHTNWAADNISEWFPSIAEKVSVVTPQGTEWLGDNYFRKVDDLYIAVKRCYSSGLNCIEDVLNKNNIQYDYAYLCLDSCGMGQTRQSLLGISEELLVSNNYDLVYNHEGVLIFKKN